MKLFFIDTHESGYFSFGWKGANEKLWNYEGRTRNLIYEITRQVKLEELKKADGICVVKGPGSFSSIRTGVLVANLLAKALKLKLYSLPADRDKMSDEDFKILKPQIFVAPEYDREPNITTAFLSL